MAQLPRRESSIILLSLSGCKALGTITGTSGFSEHVCLLSLSSLIKPWPDQRSVPWSETMHSVLSSSVRKELVTANCNTRLRIELTFVNDLLFLHTTNRIVREPYEIIGFSFRSAEVCKKNCTYLHHWLLLASCWQMIVLLHVGPPNTQVVFILDFTVARKRMYESFSMLAFTVCLSIQSCSLKVFDFLRQHCTLVGSIKFMRSWKVTLKSQSICLNCLNIKHVIKF